MKHAVILRTLCFLALSLCATHTSAQEALRFKDEVVQIKATDASLNKKDIILFTGSSSIRIWNSIQSDFPKYNIVNRGFGGSQASDLLYWFDQLILPYHPKKIFIYEGDNDISAGKSADQILATMDSIIVRIREKISTTVPIYLISPKPSLSRWQLKDKYIELNAKMKELTSKKKLVVFVDVWTPALDENGLVIKDIFLEDGLHMNEKGYAIWRKVLGPYLP